MKRLVCLLLVVSIACAGCYKKYEDPLGVTVERPTKSKDRQSNQVLRAKIGKLENELSRLKGVHSQNKSLLVRMGALEIELASKTELSRVVIEKLQSQLREPKTMQKQNQALLSRISELEVMLETQRIEEKARFERMEDVCFAYDIAVDAQRVTIDTLQKLCRLYESEIE